MNKMPIVALPKATVHLLGSSQVLTTPTSLVKELIDNSLDAKATSIDILISKNTLDRLEVRDNGHGISSEDYDSLGKRGHTSKLRTFEELKFIGGVTLGFRGEALASAVELGDVSVTTKTEGEAVATKLVLKAPGGVHQQSRTSHPVGTTVSVVKFMYKIPVRKQTFEKEATKTLGKISQLLRSYALARPSVRFSLKVTNGGKGSWSFAPRPNDGIKEAVSQVVGRDAAMECFEKSLTLSELHSRDLESGDYDGSDGNIQEISQPLGGCFAIEAFLPKNNANMSKIGTGQYVSIDSRPVSHEKGTMKKIVTLFKKYIRSLLTDPTENLKNPFIRLNIRCPIASYDANVEPAKDDVLFGNESVVLEIVENLLKDVYGDLQQASIISAPISPATKLDGFELLLARTPAPTPKEPAPTPATGTLPQRSLLGSSSPMFQATSPPAREPSAHMASSITEPEESGDEQVGSDRRKWGFDMSKDLSEDVDGNQIIHNRRLRHNPHPTLDHENPLANPLNPWIIAKLTAPSRHDRAKSEPTPAIEESAVAAPPSPLLGSDQLSHLNTFVPISTRPRQTFHSDNIRALQLAVNRQYPSARNRRPEVDDDEIFVERDPPRRRNDFVSARNMPKDALILSPPPQFPKVPPRSRGPNRPLVSMLTTGGGKVVPADRLVQTKLFGSNPRPRRQSDSGHVMPQIDTNPDLVWAMEFEQRKEDATRRRRKELDLAQMEAKLTSSSGPPRTSPHKNRYNAAIASLEADQPRRESPEQPKKSFKTTLPDGDPRAYLMRRQKSIIVKGGEEGQRLMSRVKSTRLPLEKTPEDQHLQNFVFNMQTDLSEMQSMMEVLAQNDAYVQRGNQNAGLMMKRNETPGVARKTREVVDLWMRTDEGKKYEVEYIFDNLLNSPSLST